MKLSIYGDKVESNENIVIISRDDSLKLGVDVTDRIRIIGKSSIISKIMIADYPLNIGKLHTTNAVLKRTGTVNGDVVDVSYSPMPESVRSIKKKINGNELSEEELRSIVEDLNTDVLSSAEIIAFVSAFNVNNASMKEVSILAKSMADTGKYVDFKRERVFDFHSLGGVPGNKITPIVVSILASEGVFIPKLSSRAVSSACGTSDFVDTFCDVEIDSERLADIANCTNGVFACGNADYAPVGKKIIDAERPMGIDPRPMMMASIMSKKLSLGITDLLIDIPVGGTSKISDIEVARDYARSFTVLGKELGMNIRCALTRASQPIGRTIGPILEAKECISTLEDKGGHISIVDKACGIAGAILEMAGFENGKSRAYDDLTSGRAHSKFSEIVAAQGGDPNIRSEDLIPGEFSKDVHAKRDGYIQFLDNSGLVAIAKGAGAPSDVGAGIILMHKKGDLVKKGDVLFTIYAENQAKLERAIDSARSRMPMHVDEGYVERITEDMIIEI